MKILGCFNTGVIWDSWVFIDDGIRNGYFCDNIPYAESTTTIEGFLPILVLSLREVSMGVVHGSIEDWTFELCYRAWAP